MTPSPKLRTRKLQKKWSTSLRSSRHCCICLHATTSACRTSTPNRLSKTLLITYERQPKDFEGLLGLEGVGPKTLRALSLISELVYEVPVSFRDPARYSFAHGGKDGHPYPVDRKTYDKSIEMLHQVVERAKVGDNEEMAAFKRLRAWL